MPLVYYPDISRESALPVFVTGIGTDYLQQSVSRPTLTDPQILISVSGTGVVVIGEKTFDLPAGTGFYLDCGVDFSDLLAQSSAVGSPFSSPAPAPKRRTVSPSKIPRLSAGDSRSIMN